MLTSVRGNLWLGTPSLGSLDLVALCHSRLKLGRFWLGKLRLVRLWLDYPFD